MSLSSQTATSRHSVDDTPSASQPPPKPSKKALPGPPRPFPPKRGSIAPPPNPALSASPQPQSPERNTAASSPRPSPNDLPALVMKLMEELDKEKMARIGLAAALEKERTERRALEERVAALERRLDQ